MKVDEKFCAEFNTVRSNNLNKEFSRKELQELLINNIQGFSKQEYMITILVNKNIIRRLGKGKNSKYSFFNNPIHIAALSNAVFSMKEYNNENAKKYRGQKKVVEVEKPKLVHVDEEYCIKFLKERGYRILKQTVNYEEV